LNKKPIWIWFDPTTNCNLKCEYCYTKSGHGSDYISTTTFDKVLKKVVLGDDIVVKGIHLNWKGEPLMNPELSGLLAMTRDSFSTAKLQWHTNGTMLTKKRANELVDANIDQLIYVSIDGGNKKSHDFNRGEGTFEGAINGLENLIEARDRKGSSKTKIGLYQIDLGIPEIMYDKRFRELSGKVDIHTRVDAVIDKGERSIAKEEMNDLGDSIIATCKSTAKQPASSCFWAGNAFFIAPNADVSICIFSNSPDGIMGNVLTEEFSEIVKKAEQFRSEIDQYGRASKEHCKHCYKPAGKVFEEHLEFL
jgi:radical SAM protein with 4Fe4S-binding SPASM domain